MLQQFGKAKQAAQPLLSPGSIANIGNNSKITSKSMHDRSWDIERLVDKVKYV